MLFYFYMFIFRFLLFSPCKTSNTQHNEMIFNALMVAKIVNCRFVVSLKRWLARGLIYSLG
jgi:hypothetical protein